MSNESTKLKDNPALIRHIQVRNAESKKQLSDFNLGYVVGMLLLGGLLSTAVAQALLAGE